MVPGTCDYPALTQASVRTGTGTEKRPVVDAGCGGEGSLLMNTERVGRWLDENEETALLFLQNLLKIPSVTGNEGDIQAFIARELKAMDLSVDQFEPSMEELRSHPAFVEVSQGYENRPNVVATWKGRGNGRSLLFNGHVDVIPEGDPDSWAHGSWSGDIADGKIYGRGASDMKSGVAAMTMAVKAIRSSGIRLKGDVILEYVMDEELSGNGTLACVMKGYKADAGICCETSSMRVQPGSIGRIWFTINIKGKAAGIQRRYEGVNAIELGYRVTKIVEAYEELRISRLQHPLYPDLLAAVPCMVGMFESGSFNSAFPDSCRLKGSMATVPGEDSDEVKRDFVRFIHSKSKDDPWMAAHPPEVLFTGYFAEPSEIPVESPIVQTLCRNYQAVMHEKPLISGREGAADIRFLNQYGKTPTVIFGPGRTEQMHANNEWVEIRDYLNSVKVLAQTVMDWCGVEE